MAQHDGQLSGLQVSGGELKIRAADTTNGHCDGDLAWRRVGIAPLDEVKRAAIHRSGSVELLNAHRPIVPDPGEGLTGLADSRGGVAGERGLRSDHFDGGRDRAPG